MLGIPGARIWWEVKSLSLLHLVYLFSKVQLLLELMYVFTIEATKLNHANLKVLQKVPAVSSFLLSLMHI